MEFMADTIEMIKVRRDYSIDDIAKIGPFLVPNILAIISKSRDTSIGDIA